MFSHSFCQMPHSDTGEVVDRETRISGVIQREETCKARSQNVIFESLLYVGHAHSFHGSLHQDFDEDSGARSRVVLVQGNHGHYMP